MKGKSMTSENFKKLILILLIITCAFFTISSAQQPQFNVTQYRAGFNGETLTVSNVSKALTSSVYAPTVTGIPAAQSRADYAYITVETDSIRWWPCTGALCTVGAPTSTTGHVVTAGSSFTVWGFANIQNLRMIRTTTDSTIQVSYYRFMSNTP
jgi:hypothetical protein